MQSAGNNRVNTPNSYIMQTSPKLLQMFHESNKNNSTFLTSQNQEINNFLMLT